jgi:hypothetical protein
MYKGDFSKKQILVFAASGEGLCASVSNTRPAERQPTRTPSRAN